MELRSVTAPDGVVIRDIPPQVAEALKVVWYHGAWNLDPEELESLRAWEVRVRLAQQIGTPIPVPPDWAKNFTPVGTPTLTRPPPASFGSPPPTDAPRTLGGDQRSPIIFAPHAQELSPIVSFRGSDVDPSPSFPPSCSSSSSSSGSSGMAVLRRVHSQTCPDCTCPLTSTPYCGTTGRAHRVKGLPSGRRTPRTSSPAPVLRAPRDMKRVPEAPTAWHPPVSLDMPTRAAWGRPDPISLRSAPPPPPPAPMPPPPDGDDFPFPPAAVPPAALLEAIEGYQPPLAHNLSFGFRDRPFPPPRNPRRPQDPNSSFSESWASAALPLW
eukprot:Sspe_Gene.16336::Locus_5754_Transcript_1_1_Confidence_1.000_Length_1147::g.16336::m.16336